MSSLMEAEELELVIDKLVAGGDGLGRHRGLPVFVPRSAPGDRLRVRVTERKRDYARGEIVEVLEPGEGRREPPCPYFAECGGCDLQHLEDDLQPRLKARAVLETLARLGKLDAPEDLAVVTGDPWGYRLRAQWQVDRHGEAAVGRVGPAVGYHRRRTHDVVPVGSCPILVPELEELVRRVPKALARSGKMPRRLDAAAGAPESEVTTAPVVEGLPRGAVEIEVAGLTYRFDARTFFQAHRGLLGRLVERVLGEAPADSAGGEAYDFYAGVGLFALPLARRYERVVAVESDAVAARYCRANARHNGLGELEVVTQALETWIDDFPEGTDRVVVDPPRGGVHRLVRQALYERGPAWLTYVSCHPATLARDLRHLVGRYDFTSLTLLDLFPQTGHVEAVAQLRRR